eukprot:TRINITY_DN54918_c0_g1_i1.p1 TRINITY_DN54918_c0_g1~~TRINITY_DN54918_c0_g1_i1.p1  ORF type:complete len:205 (+),score=39.98 TRINITY_DN54918_c0_g1_i1:27-617(+)
MILSLIRFAWLWTQRVVLLLLTLWAAVVAGGVLMARPASFGMRDSLKLLLGRTQYDEAHLPVWVDGGWDYASFAGFQTKVDLRVRNLKANARRVYDGVPIPEGDVLTPPKTLMDQAALRHDLRLYHAAHHLVYQPGNPNLQVYRNAIDKLLIKENLENAFSADNPSVIDRLTNLLSAAAFSARIVVDWLRESAGVA